MQAASEISQRKRRQHYSTKRSLFQLFFYLSRGGSRPVHTQPRGQVAQRGMKARHQFKKSTPLVVEKNPPPRGVGGRNPCQAIAIGSNYKAANNHVKIQHLFYLRLISN